MIKLEVLQVPRWNENPTKLGLALPQPGGHELDATGTVEHDACPYGTSLFIYRLYRLTECHLITGKLDGRGEVNRRRSDVSLNLSCYILPLTLSSSPRRWIPQGHKHTRANSMVETMLRQREKQGRIATPPAAVSA